MNAPVMVPVRPTRVSSWVPILLLLLLWACGGGDGGNGGGGTTPPPAPPPAPGPPPGVPQITGTERIGWEQGAATLQQAQGYRYVLYVNDAAQPFPGHTCTSGASTTVFACEARLRGGLPAGLITLSLAAVLDRDGSSFESPRSAPLQVFVLSAGSTAGLRPTGGLLRIPGAEPAAERRGTSTLVDLAPLPDGRLLAADAEGRVVLVENGELVSPPALDPVSAGTSPVATLAAAPDFARTRAVFSVEATEERGAPVWDVVRYRELAGVLGERAVILPSLARREGASVRLRFGPDGLAYVSVAAGSASAASGVLLRFETDGRAPAGQPTLVFRSNVAGGRALDWHPASGALWIAGEDVVSGAFVRSAGADGVALLVALADGTLQRRLVSPSAPSHIIGAKSLAVRPSERATALARGSDGLARVATASEGRPPRVRPIDARY